jgi:hypothetical protein
MNLIVLNILNYIKHDYSTNPFRFIIEITAWFLSIGCALTMALTVPTPPLLIRYPIFITQCVMFGGCAYSRRSFGMIANYSLLVTIDCVGLARMLIN